MNMLFLTVLGLLSSFVPSPTEELPISSPSIEQRQQSVLSESIVQDAYVETVQEEATTLSATSSSSAYNMVNYNIETGTISYKYFNPDSYAKREPTSQEEITTDTVSSVPLSVKSYDDNDEMLYTAEISLEEDSTNNTTDNSISLMSIIGDGERTLVSNPKEYPYKATAKIVMRYYNVYNNTLKRYQTVSSRGTGFLEGRNLLVTAGHCAYGDVTKEGSDYDDGIYNPRSPDKIEVYFGLDGTSNIENDSYQYYAEALVINIIDKEFYNDISNDDHDWAAIELDCDMFSLIGLSYGKISNWYKDDYEVFTWGYPADKGSSMWESYGKTLKNYSYRFDYDFDTVGGQSGSPVFVIGDDGNRYVCGIHTLGSSTANGATRFSNFIFHYLNSFVA